MKKLSREMRVLCWSIGLYALGLGFLLAATALALKGKFGIAVGLSVLAGAVWAIAERLEKVAGRNEG